MVLAGSLLGISLLIGFAICRFRMKIYGYQWEILTFIDMLKIQTKQGQFS
jgi:hypothetical protein